MIFWQLFYEFFKIGLFAFGGGLAALPFLYHLSIRSHWFDYETLSNMVAIAQSAPGPFGINITTFVGYHVAGFIGALVAILGIALPSLIFVLLVAKLLNRYQDNFFVHSAFYGLRPAVLALIVLAALQFGQTALLHSVQEPIHGAMQIQFATTVLDARALILMAALLFLTNRFPKHPIFYIAISAVIGIIFKL